MTPRRVHVLAVLAAVLFAVAPLAASVSIAPSAAGDTTTHTPVLGPSLLNANQTITGIKTYVSSLTVTDDVLGVVGTVALLAPRARELVALQLTLQKTELLRPVDIGLQAFLCLKMSRF